MEEFLEEDSSDQPAPRSNEQHISYAELRKGTLMYSTWILFIFNLDGTFLLCLHDDVVY